MSDASQPRKARGKVLPVGIVASALIALLAFAPLASATVDPVGGGSTTLTLQKKYTEYLKTFGIKIKPIKPAKWQKGTTATFKVTGGSIEPTTGKGELTHSGGLKLTAGKKSATLKALVVNLTKKEVTAKVGKKRIGVFKLAGIKLTRSGFNANVAANKVKLTPKAATALNEALGFAGGKPLPFLKNKNVGKAAAAAEPTTLGLVPGGAMTFSANPETLGKLAKAAVKLEVIPPTTQSAATVFGQPISGGTIAPAGNAGLVESTGGLKLVQEIEPEPGKKLSTTITLAGFFVDLAAKTVTVEVVAASNASPELNLGALGRSSIADLTVASVASDTATRTVTVSSNAALQEISAKVLNGFVSVYKAAEASPLIPKTNPTPLAPGESLGSFTVTSTTE